jgi:hypothetical protein
MIIYDFFSGTGSSTQAFKDAGHTVITFELDPQFEATENVDVTKLRASELIQKYGKPDFVWASPPCTSFSVASMGHHWINGGDNPLPRTQAAADSMVLVLNTRRLIEELNPRLGFIIENPRGMLRKLPILRDLPRATVTYCQYGDSRMKPTDLWGWVDGWMPRPMCSPGADCHESAPRGSKSGTQGLSDAKTRSMIPHELGVELLAAMTKSKS